MWRETGKLDLRMAADPVAVEGQRSCRAVVDDVIARIMRAATDMEIAGCERAFLKPGEYAVVEIDLVPRDIEIGDLVDVVLSKRRVEHEGIVSAIALQQVGPATAIYLVIAVVAEDRLAELVARQIDSGLAARAGGGKLLDMRAGGQSIAYRCHHLVEAATVGFHDFIMRVVDMISVVALTAMDYMIVVGRICARRRRRRV